MPIETPLIKPETLSKFESDFGTSIARHIWQKVMLHQLWVNKSLPVGMILSFYASQTDAAGTPIDLPKEKYWQYCDGGVISNPNSPLNGSFLPNLKEKFLKGATTIGLTGGQSTVNLSHNHGGSTSAEFGQQSDNKGDPGGDSTAGTYHAHSIASSLGSSISVIPKYLEMQYYMRVDGGGTNITSSASAFGQFIEEESAKFGKIMSQELATSLYFNSLALNALIPIGGIVPIMTNIPNVGPADPNVWQECDGSEITNPASPLRSLGGTIRTTPNMIDTYIKVPAVFGLAGDEGGVNDVDMSHNHSGYTDYYTSPGGMDRGTGAGQARLNHRHSLPSSNMGLINFEPPHYTVKFYMRIQ